MRQGRWEGELGRLSSTPTNERNKTTIRLGSPRTSLVRAKIRGFLFFVKAALTKVAELGRNIHIMIVFSACPLY